MATHLPICHEELHGRVGGGPPLLPQLGEQTRPRRRRRRVPPEGEDSLVQGRTDLAEELQEVEGKRSISILSRSLACILRFSCVNITVSCSVYSP